MTSTLSQAAEELLSTLDTFARTQAWQRDASDLDGSLLTVNQWRVRRGLPPVHWGDILVPPVNRREGVPGIKAAGLAVLAADTGRVLMLQRALEEGDLAAGRWEFPGGGLEHPEDPLDAAKREWSEETGCPMPAGVLAGKWESGVYCGYVWQVGEEAAVPVFDGRDSVSNPDDPDGDRIEALAWWDLAQLTGSNPGLRDELRHALPKVLAAFGDVHSSAHSTRTRAADVVMRDGEAIKVSRDRKGRFAAVGSAAVVSELGDTMARLKKLIPALSEDERGSLEEALSHLDFVHAPRKERADAGGRTEAELDTVWGGNIQLNTDPGEEYVDFTSDDFTRSLDPATAEEIADALDKLSALPVPPRKSPETIEPIGRVDLETDQLAVERYDDGSLELFEVADDGLDYEGVRLSGPYEAEELADLLEELAETATAANAEPQIRQSELQTRLVSLLTRGADMDVTAWNLANPKHMKGPDGKWLKGAGRTGVLGKVLDGLEALRDKLSDEDRSELDRVMVQLRELESSDVDDDDLIEEDDEEPDADELDDDSEDDGLVMESATGDLTFIPYSGGDIDVDWDEGSVRFTPASAAEVVAAISKFADLPVTAQPELPDPPDWVNDRTTYSQWATQWFKDWAATPEGIKHTGISGQATTSDGELKVARYGWGGYRISDPDTVDSDDDDGVIGLDDADEGRLFAKLMQQALDATGGTP